jgi:hypothetical protein
VVLTTVRRGPVPDQFRLDFCSPRNAQESAQKSLALQRGTANRTDEQKGDAAGIVRRCFSRRGTGRDDVVTGGRLGLSPTVTTPSNQKARRNPSHVGIPAGQVCL